MSMTMVFYFALKTAQAYGRMLTLGRYCPLSRVMSVQVKLSRACTRGVLSLGLFRWLAYCL